MKPIAIAGSIAFLGFVAIASARQTQTHSPGPAAASVRNTASGGSEAKTTMKNVNYYLTDKIMVHINLLNGKLTPQSGQIVLFDDKQSFAIDVDSAAITLTTTLLTNDLNDYVFAKPDAPLKNLTATIQGEQVTVKGLLVSKGGIPFSTTGTLAVTPEGMIRVHTTKVKALRLPVKGLMDMLGLDTAELLNTKKVPGVFLDKDDLILDPQYLLPPPPLRGRVTRIKIENGQIALTFGAAEDQGNRLDLTNTCGASSYMQFKGGTVRFGNLTMHPADLVLMDMQSTGTFGFAIDHYREQLVAGYFKMAPQGGLCAHVPNFGEIQHRANGKK